MADFRSKKIVYLAHCLLNQNAKVRGLAGYPGAFEPLARILLKSGVGLVQLPCPEMACLGPKRPLGTDTVEQYDTKRYRAVCRKLARAAARELKAYQKAGYNVLGVLGVEGSPSCSVGKAPRLVRGKRRLVKGRGLFMEALTRELARNGLNAPFMGVPECPEAGALGSTLKKVERMAKQCK